MNALEEEVALIEASNEIENAQNDLEEGEELAEIADDEVAAGEEIIAEADAKAAETSEEPSIPVEEVVASQEALKTLIRLSGSEDIAITGTNRESIYNDSYTTYKQNLEGLKEVGAKIKETVKKIWEKIVAAFNWIVEQIKKVLPTKINRIKWLLNKFNNTGNGDLTEATKKFENEYGEKYSAVGSICGKSFEDLKAYFAGVMRSVKGATKACQTIKIVKTEKEYEASLGQLDDMFSTNDYNDVLGGLTTEKTIWDEAAKKNDGERKNLNIVAVSAKGSTLTTTFAVTPDKISSSDKEVKTFKIASNIFLKIDTNLPHIILIILTILAAMAPSPS